jgi:hypothetical protein
LLFNHLRVQAVALYGWETVLNRPKCTKPAFLLFATPSGPFILVRDYSHF